MARSADDASMTQSGVIAGTPLYMSPEQAQAHEIDFRSDLFSLGSVLYVACSGRPPFRAPSTLAVLKRVIEDQPRPIQSIIPETPDWLAAIIGCLHAKQPAHRFASALELSELLSDCLAEFERQGKVEALAGRLPMPAGATASMLADDSVAELNRREATADAAGHRTARPLRRWAAAAAVLLALLVGLGMGETIGVTDVRGIVVRLFSPVGKFVSEANAPDVSVSVDGTQPLSHEAVVNENTSKPDLHEVIATKGDAARLHERVNTAISDPTTPAAQDAKQGRRTEFASPPAQIVRGDWRMEGAELVQHKIKTGLRSIVLFGDPEWTDYDVSVETLTTAGQDKSEGGDLLFRVQSPDDFYAFSLGGYGGTLNELSFRQKGRWGREAPLKWAANQTNRWYKVRVEVRGSQMRCWVDDQQQLDWQDSRFAQGRVGLRTWGVNTPVRWKNLKVVSPDGQILLEGFPELGPAAPEPGLIPSPSAALAALRREQIPPSALAFAGNGDPQQAPPSLVAVLGEPEMIQGGNIPSLAFSPDGRWLASASVDGTILLREATTGQTRQRIRGGRFGVSNVAFTPDSQTLVAQADGRIKLWPLGQEAEPSAVLHLDVEWLHMALSPDGRFLAACGADGVVKLWTWGQWDKPRVLPAVGASGWSILAFSADGELLACGWRWGTPKIALYGTRDGALKQTLVAEHGKGVT
ncbi:MAG TPA: family 16 glycoside hydrolase, partial [Pirellulales bacterium]|nr:family 16 glycoside hydrolase [Pirellulales bacterium]